MTWTIWGCPHFRKPPNRDGYIYIYIYIMGIQWGLIAQLIFIVTTDHGCWDIEPIIVLLYNG